uniref:CDC20/Fizzy WD40 domain-containing protein n=1 Tax=Mucochytrium quahogii TaxID=96639 RepID=A0A7S2WBP6_9STRA|mmetsp:Transcript_42754/g.68740  ORF Transcript_42754/g.68740 Transcript_42754/m.68740 type:complete len:499 (+) Transcript_42754:338-1834(+)|eukprot:CAMPEP_0203748058 /NCGR_PEP_ID=MMETSP0098-20131031/3035_1 /ASSEMBLY_ACC=CAM_ASM_000208 /TAXON_ID=96639 /ORGANISM=" , Strain NY0313808BC1" /LENGTH=498 /DNA_ID=CAMNT_0050636673 /DNA_START=115 /DNA_END=1611 /DNA_ORIENTATION=-
MAANTYVQEQMELEDCLNFNQEIDCEVQPRWKRKALQQRVAKTPKSGRKRSRSKTPAKGKNTPQHDRFIPNRGAMDLANAHFNLMKENNSAASNAVDSPTRAEFNKALANSMGAGDHRVLAFKKKAPAPPEGYENSLKVLYTQNKAKLGKTHKPARHIPSAPERILDAPDLLDDYYLNLVDWGSSNMLAVALGQTVYLWNAETGGIEELCQCEGEDDYITSVKFVQEGGGYLAVGTNFCETKLWDIETSKLLRNMDGHSARVSSLAWNQHILSSGSRDSTIVHHDVRVAQHKVGVMEGHLQEVCGLTWSPDGQTLASGGNDNLLCLWDARYADGGSQAARAIQAPRLKISDHLAAVKALAWCPHQRNVLASGGGTADRTIKMWNAANGACLNSVDTGSQVCSLLWNPHEKELLSSHGFSENQLCLWKYPSMVKTKELSGHTSRVLHMALSPDGTMVCSGAADETLRFWKVFEEPSKTKTVKKVRQSNTRGSLQRMNIR